MKIHTGIKPYKCRHCDRQFTQSNDLKRHTRLHSGEKSKVNGKRKLEINLQNKKLIHDGSSNKYHACYVCSKVFSSSSNLMNHVRVHNNMKPFKCNLCDKRFAHNGNLRKHKRIHTDGKPYKCKECDGQFSCSSDLKTHSELHLTKFEHGPCDEAGFESTVINERNSLVPYAVVLGSKGNTCDVCCKHFLLMVT